MRRGAVWVALALSAGAALADDAKRFEGEFAHAARLVQLGRRLEGRENFAVLAFRLRRFDADVQIRNAERLCAALATLGDTASAELAQRTLVETTILNVTHSRSAVDDLPREPRARGLELCRMALACAEDAPQRRVLMRGALVSLARVGAPDAEVQHRLGLCHLELGDRARAMTWFRAAVAADPHSAGPRVALARLHLAQDHAAEAVALLEHVLGRALEREAVELLARGLVKLDAAGQGADARRIATRWSGPGTDPRVMAPLWEVAGQLAERDGDLSSALSRYASAAAHAPSDALIASVGRTARAVAARSAGERKAVIAALGRCARPDPATPPKLLQLAGELALRDGDLPLAIKLYGAGFAGRERGAFEPLLSELRQSARQRKQHHVAMLVDMVIGPPKVAEPDKSYVVVELGDARCAVDVASGAIAGPPPARKELADFAKTVGEVMKEYPPAFAQKLKLWKFALAESPPAKGRGWMGLTDPQAVTIHVNINTAVTGPDDWRVALHHELFHLIDHQDDGEVAPDHPWRKLNRPGFLYTYNKDVPCDPITASSGVEVAGFVNAYATTGVEEDKAVTFANMMVFFDKVEERAARDPIVMAKMERIRRVTRGFCPALGDAFWDGVKGRAAARAAPAATD